MELKLSQAALDGLVGKLARGEAGQVIRVYLAGIGCGGGGRPSFSVVLDQPQATDKTVELPGITVYYDKLIPMHTEKLEITYDPARHETEQFKVNAI